MRYIIFHENFPHKNIGVVYWNAYNTVTVHVMMIEVNDKTPTL